MPAGLVRCGRPVPPDARRDAGERKQPANAPDFLPMVLVRRGVRKGVEGTRRLEHLGEVGKGKGERWWGEG